MFVSALPQRESAEGKLNALSLHIVHGNGDVTVEEAIVKMKGIIEDKKRELLRLVLQEKGSIVPRDCKELFWKMMKVLNLFYMKDDGFTSHEMHSTVDAVLKEPIVLSELLADSKQNISPLSKAQMV